MDYTKHLIKAKEELEKNKYDIYWREIQSHTISLESQKTRNLIGFGAIFTDSRRKREEQMSKYKFETEI